ncbi:hypothetical protein NMG60_11015951 [Bertholletia excelsa]
MASLWCLHSKVGLPFPTNVPSSSCKEARWFSKSKRLQVLCYDNDEHSHKNPSVSIQCQSATQRRHILFQTLLSAFSVPPVVSAAIAENNLEEDFRLYSDEVNKFKLMVPQDWQVGAGESDGVRSVTGFYPEEPSSSNVIVVITGLGADFTRLESFGKVDAFAENLVSGLDRSWQRPSGVTAKLIDSKAANGLYYIEYTLQNPGESRRHLYSVLGIANNGYYNRLYTVTGQFIDEDSEKYGSKVEKAIASFRLN